MPDTDFTETEDDSEDDLLVLVVDDEPENLTVVGEILKKARLPFIFATSGDEALDAIRAEKPTLVLLDIMMPGHDGISICKMIKSDSAIRDIPIIFLTAKAERENIVEGFEAGGVDYIVKPFRSEELLARIKTHLELFQYRKSMHLLSERKSELISMLAHGVKNPAGAIYSIARSLILDIENNEADLDEIKTFLKLIDASATGLAELVERTLDEERAQQNQSDEEVDIDAIVEYLVTLNTVHARKRKIHIRHEKQFAFVAKISSRSIIEIFDNLINNAVKYSKNGSEVIVRLLPVKNRPDYWRFEVEDSAELIPQDISIVQLGDKYKRAGKANPEEVAKSHGVGLSIVHRLVEECDGRVGKAHRKDGKGNVFFIELPYEV